MVPPRRHLTDPDQNAGVLRLAGELLADDGPAVIELDHQAATAPDRAADPVELEALRCAASRARLQAWRAGDDGDAELAVVWAMYGETERLRPNDEATNPHGEDLLRAKVGQIRWLVDGLDLRWHLLAVDDGCPDGSGALAREIAATLTLDGRTERVSVLDLGDGLGRSASPVDVDLQPLSPTFLALTDPAQSRKGGSILYGLWHAVQLTRTEPDRQVVCYTDADLSVNLGQLGLLAAPILAGQATACAGQRYGLERAILVNPDGLAAEPAATGSKPDKMIVLFRHNARAALFPGLAHVPDTQAGFKAFRADALVEPLRAMSSFDESFDVELLLRFLRAADETAGDPLSVAPIVFVEDFAQSNFVSVDPEQRHLDMVGQLVDIADRLDVEGAEDWRAWLRGLDLPRYQAIIEGLRSLDAERAEDDPLFDARWSIDDLERLTRPGTTVRS